MELKQFAFCPPLRNLLLKNGTILPFKSLPKTHQMAIAHYMCVDGAAWAADDENRKAFPDWKWGEGTPHQPRRRLIMLRDLKTFMPRFVQHFGDELFGMAKIPTQDLLKIITEYNPYYSHDDFSTEVQGSYIKPTWPSILHDSEEILEDGWTRFHDRIALGIKTTPVVWYE